ncbi:MAG TPA: hypothetical protein VG944_08490 [Fimbriimonas sp.]|nr:hypothetical protein [Fimbriimonas sp.]
MLTITASAGAVVQTHPYEAEVTSFQTSLGANGWHYLTATVHFRNMTDHELILGCDMGHVSATDDQGNKYGLLLSRGIGAVTATTFDPKFKLKPNGGGDALFDMRWRGDRSSVVGTTFDLNLTTQLIEPSGADRYKLGSTRILDMPGLKSGMFAPPQGAPPISDRTVDAGPFTAKITRAKATISGNRRWTTTEMTIQFTNTSDKPLILAYEGESSFGTDEQGNRYGYGTAGTHDTSVSGIGMVGGASADPSFVLQPGESREANFSVARRLTRDPNGTQLAYYVALGQLEVLPSRQVRQLRQFSLTFPGLPATG